MIRHRLSPVELQRPCRIVEKTPIASDRALKQALPRLIEGLDQIDLPAALLGGFHHTAQHQGLVSAGGQRTVAHASGARPTDLPDPNLLPSKGFCHLGPHGAYVLDGTLGPDGLIFPIGENVDGDEVDSGRKLGRLQPELPNIGIGDG